MIDVKYCGNDISPQEKEEIWDLLCICDKEFFPPLSARESSSQKNLLVNTSEDSDLKPQSYFSEMIKQFFVLAKNEENHIIGFMTFKVNYSCDALEKFGPSSYITTVCVTPEYRKQGVMNMLYDLIENEVPKTLSCNRISTRTWSTNKAQIHSLKKRGYKEQRVLVDDRGPGIDTIYYGLDLNL